MTESLAERLAKAAVDRFDNTHDELVDVVVDIVRTALDEAAKVALEHEIVLDDGPFAKWTTKGGRFGQEIAAAIEALK